MGYSAEQVRGDPAADAPDFWARHRQAFSALLDVERMAGALARQGQDTTYITEVIPALYRAVFAVTTPWSNTFTQPRDSLDPNLGRTVRAFAALFDEYNIRVDTSAIQRLRESLGEVERLLLDASPDEMPRNTRIYLLGLIADAIEALADPSRDGGRYARTAAHAAAGALTAELAVRPRGTTTDTAATTKTFWQRLTKQVSAVVVGTAIAFGAAFGTQAGEAVWQLTEGLVSEGFSDMSDACRPEPETPSAPKPEVGSTAIGPGPTLRAITSGTGDTQS